MKRSKKKRVVKSKKRLTPKNLDPNSTRRDDLTRLDDEEEWEPDDDSNEDDE